MNIVRNKAIATSLLILGLIISATILPGKTNVSAQSTATLPFLATAGCSMSHCDQSLSGDPHMNAPTGSVTAAWHDTSVAGSSSGLGCVSNTTLVACSFTQGLVKKTTLKEYRADGTAVWSSSLLNASAYASVPMISPSGNVIAADSTKIVNYSSTGQLIWQTATPGGTPISPTITDNGAIILATAGGGGPISAYDSTTGAMLDKMSLNATININGVPTAGYYDTVNTPGVNGNRFYIETQFRDSATNAILPYGRLYALDLTRAADGSGKLSVAWSYDFEAPSGGSPSVLINNGIPTVYFDGTGTTPGATTTNPQLFALKDLGTSAQLAWMHAVAVDPQTAATPDPRGGIWTYSTYSPDLIRLDQNTGALLQTIDTSGLVSPPGIHVPSSAMTIAGTAQNPVMMVSVAPILMQSVYVVAINLNTSQLVWSYRIDQNLGIRGDTFAQYPIVLNSEGLPEVVVATADNGVWALAAQ